MKNDPMQRTRPSPRRTAFTLVELLVSMVIIVMIMLVLVSITDSTRKTWAMTTGKIEEFRQAREAFDSMTRRLSQATLRTYWDYRYVNNNPTNYIRQSELRFISGSAGTLVKSSDPTHAIFFQSPLGMVGNSTYTGLETLLNTCGYFIEFGSDQVSRPPFISAMTHAPALRYRYRLMEMVESSENLTLYQYTSGYTNSSNTTQNNPGYYTSPNTLVGMTAPTSPTQLAGTTGLEWFTAPLNSTARPVRVLGENIIALILLPKLSSSDEQALINSGPLSGPLGTNLAPKYSYDSTAVNSVASINPKNQLPPSVQVTMVAVDEPSFLRLQGSSTTRPSPDPLFADSSGNALFTDATKYDADLQSLQQTLNGQSSGNHFKLNYRVFTTSVDLKAAKWSRDQTLN